jgi:hypothetical protein
MTGKDPTINDLLTRLRPQERGWTVVDHWSVDQCAIGIARSDDRRRLVYVSTFQKADGLYDFECETPAGPGDTDYVSVRTGQNVDIVQLMSVLEQHLTPVLT